MKFLLLLLIAVGSSLAAVNGTCQTVVVPTTIRATGHAESIGDIVVYCFGVTGSGNVDVSITVGAPVTSRVLIPGPPPGIEALLLINEPGISARFGGPVTQIGCDADTARLHLCPTGANVVQGEVFGAFGVTFHVPIDGSSQLVSPPNPPFTILRITNVRVNAGGVPLGLGGVG
ncbi:MAG TPA: hypothetical protein VGF59_01660, partial [Bryobacteraceae bacterium]